jgi:hypothetical protein
MCWLVVVRNVESGRLEIITPDMEFDCDDPRYDKTVHIIPFKTEPDPQRLNFGVHNLGEDCVCRPKITDSWAGQRIISHRAVVN